jgi:hypothetical protein
MHPGLLGGAEAAQGPQQYRVAVLVATTSSRSRMLTNEIAHMARTTNLKGKVRCSTYRR